MMFPRLENDERFLGLTTTNVAVTLLKCFKQSSSGTLGPVPWRLEILANCAIVGLHATSGHSSIPTDTDSQLGYAIGRLDTY